MKVFSNRIEYLPWGYSNVERVKREEVDHTEVKEPYYYEGLTEGEFYHSGKDNEILRSSVSGRN